MSFSPSWKLLRQQRISKNDYRRFSPIAHRSRTACGASHLRSPDCGGMENVIGLGLTSRLSRTKAGMARGFMPTSTAKKAMRAMQLTGMVGRASPFAEKNSMRNG
jgi:hypothetical protein